MKPHPVIFILFLIVSTSTVKAQDGDTAAINKAIEKYILGWRAGDTDLLKETFDLEAGVVLWIDRKGEAEKMKSMTLSDLADRVRPQPDYGMGFEIIETDIINSELAMAKVKIPLPSKESHYIDYLQLQKINGLWKIVLKSYVYFPME